MAKDYEVTDPMEGILEEPAVNFAMSEDFHEVRPSSVELHFGAMQLSTAISMKRIADSLQQWIDLVTAEDVAPKQDDLDRAYIDGFKAGQRSVTVNNDEEEHEVSDFIPDEDDEVPDIDVGEVPSKTQMS